MAEVLRHVQQIRCATPIVWQAKTGPLNFYHWLQLNRPELIPTSGVDPYQILSAQLADCTDA